VPSYFLVNGRYPRYPRSIGIMNLAENCEIIHGAQQVAGKILSAKHLEAASMPKCSSKRYFSSLLLPILRATKNWEKSCGEFHFGKWNLKQTQ